MVINIYGVGRSGTKAVQLYLAYLLAEQYGQVRLNYEPYFWLNRSGTVNFVGIRHHLEAPHFCKDQSAYSRAHRQYLTRLRETEGMPVVTKFIRANGCIPSVEAIMQPDYSILVVRSVYEVLASLNHMDWNLFSVGYRYFPQSHASFWNEIASFLNQLEDHPLPANWDKLANDIIVKNALYWYAMNRAALEQATPGMLVLDYAKLGELSEYAAQHILKRPVTRQVSDAEFLGKHIHQAWPLQNVETAAVSRSAQRWNEWRLYLGRGRFRRFLPGNWAQQMGEVVQCSTAPPPAPSGEGPKVKTMVHPHPLLDALNEDIMGRVKKWQHQPVRD